MCPGHTMSEVGTEAVDMSRPVRRPVWLGSGLDLRNHGGGPDKGGGLIFCKPLNSMLRALIRKGATTLS